MSEPQLSELCQHLREEVAYRERHPFLYGDSMTVPPSLKCPKCEREEQKR